MSEERYLKSARQMIANKGRCAFGGATPHHICCRDCFYNQKKNDFYISERICGGVVGTAGDDSDGNIAGKHIRDARLFITKNIPVHIEMEGLE